ncbi:MAG: hypothetical protein FWG27_08465 [Treponema sp.]|nr:hypothetical protein [Treponema sp.]
MTRFFAFIGCVTFFLSGLSAQIPLVSAGNGAPVQEPELSLYTLLRAAEGSHTHWRPDWPLDLPPDLFVVHNAASITADFGDGQRLEYSRDSNGKIRSFPVLMQVKLSESGEKQGTFFQGRCDYDPQGRIAKLYWNDLASDQSGGSDVEVLTWDDEGRPLMCRVFSGDYFFTALEYLSGSTNETWYNRDGKALFVVKNERAGQIRISAAGPSPDGQTTQPQEDRFFYNSEGSISKIENSLWSVSAVYDPQRMPRYLVTEAAALPSSKGAVEVYSWQWDMAGRLVRFSGNSRTEVDADPPAIDFRYEYTLDSRENWTERREISMVLLNLDDPILVPNQVRTIRRLIRYGAGR